MVELYCSADGRNGYRDRYDGDGGKQFEPELLLSVQYLDANDNFWVTSDSAVQDLSSSCQVPLGLVCLTGARSRASTVPARKIQLLA